MEDSRTRAARTHFDRWSESYEHDPVSRRLRGLQSAALAALSLAPGDVFLDVACGTGAAVREAAQLVRRAVGLDLSPALIARARTLAEGTGNVEFTVADVSGRLPFTDREFTALICSSAFHHFPRPEFTIGEMSRVVAPGGRLVIADANRRHPAVFAFDQVLRRLQASHVGLRRPSLVASDLRAAGFARTEVCTIWGRSFAFVRAEKADRWASSIRTT